jgi:hypothetical protein
LVEPPLAEVGSLISANRRRFSLPVPEILGRTDLRLHARQSALAAAREYLKQCGEPVPEGPEGSILMAGHQPDLFHPGVWVKNFALHGLAKAHGAMPLNLIVDSDSAKSTALRVPAMESEQTSEVSKTSEVSPLPAAPEQVKLLSIPFDRWTQDMAYEELQVNDRELFARYPDQVVPILRAWKVDCLLPAFWSEARGSRTDLIGERFAAARRAFERRWGCHNLEMPVSAVCRTEDFAWFACHLLAHLPRFHGVYNTSLLEYRRRHGIRSRSHPVPELATEAGWLETPFWAWRPENPRRRRLLARQQEADLELRLDSEPIGKLPIRQTLATHHSAHVSQDVVSAWRELERRGIKIRGRALLTTLYARLFLADLFIHGIGGAKYDELTDEIIRRFFGMEPPEYLVLSATVLLPLPTYPATLEDCLQLGRELRDLNWNPQRHLTEANATGLGATAMEIRPAANQLAAQKREWILRQPQDAQGRRERFLALRALTAQLNAFLATRQAKLRQDLMKCERQLQANAILQRRDYAFCLYPEATLRPFFSQFLA